MLGEARDRGLEPLLPNDGHFSPAGARVVAAALAEWMRELGLELPDGNHSARVSR